VKKLLHENSTLSNRYTQGLEIFNDCVSNVRKQYTGDVSHDTLSLPDKVKILDLFAQHTAIEPVLQSLLLKSERSRLSG
jgi:hypothetical protein